MQYKLWGVRGSLPKPETPLQLQARIKNLLQEFAQSGKGAADVDSFLSQKNAAFIGGYGGNTSCYEVAHKGESVVIDGGSGIKELGMELIKGPAGQGKGVVHIFMTHFHWDHLIGLPFFVPIFIPGNEIHFYAVQDDLETVIKSLFRKPCFPVNFEWLGSKIHFHKLEPRKKLQLHSLSLTPYQLDHPDPCWGFKISDGEKNIAHCVDTECTRVTRKELGKDLALYQDIDLMIFDAQYTLVELVDKINWGHAVAGLGLDIAMREKVKKVVFVHHDPYASNEKIQAAEKQTRTYYEQRLSEASKLSETLYPVEWEFAVEGNILEV